jgi:hypothetical protein
MGSNASPAQLDRTFTDKVFRWPDSAESVIPVSTAVIRGVDIVYAAHLALYGSLPATLLASQHSTASVFVTWLTDRQFARTNLTERVGESPTKGSHPCRN